MDAHHLAGAFAAVHWVSLIHSKKRHWEVFPVPFLFKCSFRFQIPCNQPCFLFALQAFDGKFALHGCGAVWLYFEVNQFHRAAGACIFCANAFVMLGYAPLRVGGPASVVSSIRTFYDVAIAGHFRLCFFTNMPPKNRSENVGISAASERVAPDQSAATLSLSQR